MTILIVLLAIYAAGLLIFVGVATQTSVSGWDDVLAVLTWPVSIPFFAGLRVWQHGRKGHHLYRYTDLKWYQRGERLLTCHWTDLRGVVTQ